MGLIRDRSRRAAPFQMLVCGLVLIGLQAYLAAGSTSIIDDGSPPATPVHQRTKSQGPQLSRGLSRAPTKYPA